MREIFIQILVSFSRFYRLSWIVVTSRQLVIAIICGTTVGGISFLAFPLSQTAEIYIVPSNIMQVPTPTSGISYARQPKTNNLPKQYRNALLLFTSIRLARQLMADPEAINLLFDYQWRLDAARNIYVPRQKSWRAQIGYPSAAVLSPAMVRDRLATRFALTTTAQEITRISYEDQSAQIAIEMLDKVVNGVQFLILGNINHNVEHDLAYLKEQAGKQNNDKVEIVILEKISNLIINFPENDGAHNPIFTILDKSHLDLDSNYAAEIRILSCIFIIYFFCILFSEKSREYCKHAAHTLSALASDPVWRARLFMVIIIAFSIALPKGGIKLGEIPITWGYIAFALGCLTLLLTHLGKLRLHSEHIITIAAAFCFCAVASEALFVFGTDDSNGFIISFYISFLMLPLAMLLIPGTLLGEDDLPWIANLIRWAVFAICLYGLLAHAYFAVTGKVFTIPGLTANADDFDPFEKDNYRFGFLKLTSTFANGNLLGANLLMMAPTFLGLEKNKIKLIMIRLVLILTCSRSVWLGMIALEIYWALRNTRITLATILRIAAIASFLIFAVFIALQTNLFKLTFLLDSNLGGRSQLIPSLDQICLFPCVKSDYLIREIVPISILDNFGIIGFICASVFFLAPIYYAAHVGYLSNPLRRHFAEGMVIYLLVACADGGYPFIPTAFIYWALAALLLVRPGTPSLFGIKPQQQHA